MKLKDRVCLVTGAAKRVGRAIALELARRGARLIIHYNHSREEALETAEACTRLAGGQREAIALEADQADKGAINRLAADAIERCGRVDVLVNNASVFHPTPFLKMTPEQWDTMIGVNLGGPAWFCRALAPGMVERGEGVIVNIADAYAMTPWRHFVPYCVAKAGLVSLTRGLARELAPAVRVNAIGPGAVLMPPGSSDSLKKKSAQASALGRLGEPEDVAAACVFLIEGSDFITGAFLPVDGGALASEP